MLSLPATAAVAFQIGLAVLEFFLINWLGKHAVSVGYFQLSFIAEADDAPAFNSLFRIVAPVVFLIVTASLLYALRLDRFVVGYYWVTVFYFAVRWCFNLVAGRALLLRWGRQAFIAASAIALSYLAYDQVIRFRRSLLPDRANLANELWVIILLFLYGTINRVQWPYGPTIQERRARYIRARYREARKSYGSLIRRTAPNRVLEALSYAVLIYESFNRPGVVQWLERRVLFPLGVSHTLGPMQIHSDDRVSDEQSVELGVGKLSRDYLVAEREMSTKYEKEKAAVQTLAVAQEPEPVDAPVQMTGPIPESLPWWWRQSVVRATAAKYNIRSDYPGEVFGIYRFLIEEYYQDLAQQELGTVS